MRLLAKLEYRSLWEPDGSGRPAVAVEVQLFWKDKRNHDVDNIKALLDALTGIVWEDDGQIMDLHTIKAVSPKNPRVQLRVWEL